MSKMKELWEEQRHEADIDSHIEFEKQELRKEGAEELRQDITRELKALVSKAWTEPEKMALMAAIIVTERASI